MGLDQYAYAINEAGDERELMTWRKHPNLQGFMEQLWEDKGRMCFSKEKMEEVPFNTEENGSCMGDFNCVPVLLDMEDIANLEDAVNNAELPYTSGFFFGTSRAEDKGSDLTFIERAREALRDGWKVVYDSWW